MPVVMTSQTSVPQSLSRRNASSASRAASVGDGGSGSGGFCLGRLALRHGFELIQPTTRRRRGCRRGSREGYWQRMYGPSEEEIQRQIWGPYRFTPGTGPDDARADSNGRETVYNASL
jgi:hypothetical protein